MPTFAYRGNSQVIEAIEGRLAEAGFTREGEPDAAQFVITFCSNMTELEDLYFGEGGLAQIAKPQSTIVDFSPATPNLAMEISGVCAVSDIAFVSAPLIVKNKLAEDAFARVNLGCFAAGDGDSVARAHELLEIVVGDIREVGDAGAAQLARAANTIQNTAEMVAAIEVIAMFKSCQKSVSPIDLKRLAPESTSPEGYFVMEAIKGKRFNGAYNVEMLLGEISAAMMTADDYDLILPQTEAAFHLYELLAIIGGAEMNPAALALVFEGDDRSEDDANAYGLDWSRVEHVYGHDEAEEVVDDWSDDDDFDFDDEDFSSGFGYSVN